MTISSPTAAVMAIGNINISGNVIPASWWRHITLPSGRPDQTAITLLSEIIYWYRPSEVRDEVTGALTGYRKRFHGDKLQRSYQAFADQFGFSKRETTDALKRLRDAGFITLELRTVKTSEGMTLSNVLFVEPVPEAIDDINTVVRKSDVKNVTPVPFQRNTPYVSTEPLPLSDVSDPTLKRETYTEITTEITTENKTHSQSDRQPDDLPGKTEQTKKQKPQIDYQGCVDAYNEVLGDRLPWVRMLTDKRKTKIRLMLGRLKTPTVSAFRAYVIAFSENARSFYFGDNNRGWRADMDFILREETLVKVREGTISESIEVQE